MGWKRALRTAAAGLMFALAGAGAVQAHDSCREKIRKEEYKLQRDVARHGFYSRQAQHRREAISRLRWQCGRSGVRRNDRWDNGRYGNHWRRNPWRRW